MSAFLPILKDKKGLFVDISGVRNELLPQSVVYKKETFDGKVIYPLPNYYNEDGKKKNEEPTKDSVVYKKLGKYTESQEVYEMFTSDTYYIRNNDLFSIGGRKPKRLTHLSKKRAMKSRRVRKSRRRYSRRKY
jgi:hypothetical protein